MPYVLTIVLGFCGNTLGAGSVPAPNTDCSMVCSGDQFEYCGAGNRLSLYSLTGSSSSSAGQSSAGETTT